MYIRWNNSRLVYSEHAKNSPCSFSQLDFSFFILIGLFLGKMSYANSNEGSYSYDAPMWNYVTKFESNKKGGGNVSCKCHYCQCNFQGHTLG